MEDVTERWLPAVGWEGLYLVSNLGQVRSVSRKGCHGRILRPSTSEFGYRRVALRHRQRSKTYFVHALVAEAFVGPKPDGQQIRHLDGDSLNNRALNLAYGTSSENVLDQVSHGTHTWARKTHCPQGHPYDEANTYIQSNGKSRGCRQCHLATKRASESRRRERLRA